MTNQLEPESLSEMCKRTFTRRFKVVTENIRVCDLSYNAIAFLTIVQVLGFLSKADKH